MNTESRTIFTGNGFTNKIDECRASGLHCSNTRPKKSGKGNNCARCGYGTCKIKE